MVLYSKVHHRHVYIYVHNRRNTFMFVTRAQLNYAQMTEGNIETDVLFFFSWKHTNYFVTLRVAERQIRK